ncbi:hypothetical protein NE865_00507 [Phthorimaea operculella]|nr:hypothetical protein NE865_00507 [Phthorimaea operculella]
MERLQNQGIRFIFGLRKFDHVTEFRQRLRWLPIRQRRDLHTLSLLFNVLFNPAAPQYLRERFVYHNVTDSRLRSCGDLSLHTPACRTKTFSQSFTIGAARLWNKIPTDVRKSSNIITFKLNLRKLWGVDQNDSDDL